MLSLQLFALQEQITFLLSCSQRKKIPLLFLLVPFPTGLLRDKLPCLFSYLAFFPSRQSFSLTKVVWQTLSVIQQPLNSLFISLVCSAILTYYRKGRLAISTAGSINLKKNVPENIWFSLCTFFSLQLWLYFCSI